MRPLNYVHQSIIVGGWWGGWMVAGWRGHGVGAGGLGGWRVHRVGAYTTHP